MKRSVTTSLFAGALAASLGGALHASSHREAPLISHAPKLDSTDFYVFNSYEAGRQDFVTFVACYQPFQTPYGGPNFFTMDPDALYEIHIDNDGDAKEDLTFQFRFAQSLENISLPIGPEGNRRTNAIPLVQAGPITAGNSAAQNVRESYTCKLIRGPRRGSAGEFVTVLNGPPLFFKPFDFIGNKTMPDYDAYVASLTYNITIPGCKTPGRLVVTQRKDPFVVNLGTTFDLINFQPGEILGPVDGLRDSLDDDNVTAIILEVPKECLVSAPGKPIIGAWTTASKITKNADGTSSTNQLSRLSMPLVNELVIGLKDKDKFSASEPKDDGQFADYVTHPTLPALVELLFGQFGVKAPTKFPRTDLVAVFATGVEGLNQNVQPGVIGEMTRLNTSIAAVPRDQQKNLGVLAGDTAGFPNGRRPGDDIVDMALRVVMGVLLPEADAPAGKLAFTDGAYIDAKMFLDKFPYLNRPVVSSPLEPSVEVTVQAAKQAQGPYTSVPATFDEKTRVLKAGKPDADMGFYRLKANGKVALGSVATDKDGVSLGVK